MRTGKRDFRYLQNQWLDKWKNSKIYFIICGFISTLWVFWRVITKPSRASYPCVQATLPAASMFIAYISSLIISILSYKYAGKYAKKARYFVAAMFMCIAVVSGFYAMQIDSKPVFANTSNSYIANSPVGEPKGVIPGRVVWFHHPGATDENWSSKKTENYFSNAYTNIDTVEAMVNESVLKLTETSSIDQAWDSLFVYFNKNHGKGAVGYQEGEHIYIKCNFVTAFTQDGTGGPTWTSPQVILSILRQLINNMSIPQEKIALGDPMVCVIDDYWNILHTEFPNVRYIDHQGGNGRTYAEKGIKTDIFYSDRGEILRDSGDHWSNPPNSGDPVYSDTLYKIIEDADYMINIAALKGHGRAGVTLCAKNHFGSHVRTTAAHQHMGLPKPGGDITRYGYGQYRIQVDLMGHKMLGGNTLLFVVDGLWAGPDAGARPEKFDMSPFNTDYTSSVFMSQDQVALESVCVDFLQAMYPNGKPQMNGVDDYLRQAADPSEWPENFVYDPENDGTLLTSLGVHEHWNNSTEKQYSKELGISSGIDFVKLTRNNITSVHDYTDNALMATFFELNQNYPNPFNPSTTITYTLKKAANVTLTVYNSVGQKVKTLVNEKANPGNQQVKWDGTNSAGVKAVSGVYYYMLEAADYSKTMRMLLLK